MTLKILLSVDGSGYSTHAADALIKHLDNLRKPAQIHVLYVHLPVPLEAATRHVDPAALTRYYREEGEAQLAPALEKLTAAGQLFTPHIEVGDPAGTIVRMAADLQCDFICMGTHGRGAMLGAVLGSVSAKVLRRSTVPVLFVRRP